MKGRLHPAWHAVRCRWRQSLLVRSPELGTLTASVLLSETATQFSVISLIWVALITTHSPAYAGLIVLCRGIPEIVTGPLFGSEFDRWNPVRLMVGGYVIRCASLAAIAMLSLFGLTNITIILFICVIMGITNPLEQVGTRVLLPQIVKKDDLHAGNGILTAGDQFPYLVGPALGGAMTGLAGAASLLVPAGMCALAAVLLLRTRIDGKTQSRMTVAQSGRRPIRHPRLTTWFGFRPMLGIPVVRAMMILTALYYFFYGPLLTAIPIFAHDDLHVGGAGYGAMWSALGVGALLGLTMIPRLSLLRPGVVNAMSAVLWGLVLLPLIAVPAFPVALVIMITAGIVWAPYVATEISVIQHWVPAHQHGAVFGARRAVIVASTPVGAALGGVLLEKISPIQVIGLSALSCIASGALCLAIPSVRSAPSLRRPPKAAGDPGNHDNKNQSLPPASRTA